MIFYLHLRYHQRPWLFPSPVSFLSRKKSPEEMLISFKHQREALHFDWLSSVSLARSIYKYGSPASRLLSQLQTYLLLLET